MFVVNVQFSYMLFLLVLFYMHCAFYGAEVGL